MESTTNNTKTAMLPNTLWDQYETAINHCQNFTQEQRNAVLWLNNLGRKENMSLSALGETINYSPTVVQRILSGSYNADPTKIITAIYRYKSIHEARQELGNISPYVQTSMAQRVWDAADYARIRQQIVSLIGMTQRGKTTAIKEYSRARGATILVRCPVSPTPTKIVRRIAHAMGNSGSASLDQYLDYLFRTLTPQHLLVVDEIHQVILHDRKPGLRTIETLREIADECGCGLLLIGTKIWCDALTRDLNWKNILEQIVKRGITIALKDTLPIKDLRQLWEHYGLPEPDKDMTTYIKTTANNVGLGRYTKLLSIGYTISTKSGQPYSWSHFLAAAQTLDDLADGK